MRAPEKSVKRKKQGRSQNYLIGLRGGENEGNPMGSRGDNERAKTYMDRGGSRTSKKI